MEALAHWHTHTRSLEGAAVAPEAVMVVVAAATTPESFWEEMVAVVAAEPR